MEPGEISGNVFFKLFFAIFLLDAGCLISFVTVEPDRSLSFIFSIFVCRTLLKKFF